MAEQGAAGIRERNRAAIQSEILRIGRRHLGEHGAAALSLRAIARELGMASSAVYRYVASRDELLTLLIIDAYNSLADEVDEALAGNRRKAAGQFKLIAIALRQWALGNPHEFALIYGSPVPDYQAPADRTLEAGTRVTGHLARLLADGAAGTDPDQERVVRAAARKLSPGLTDPAVLGHQVAKGALVRGLAAWSLIVGAVTAEVFEQYGPDVSADPETHFEAMVALASSLVFER